MDGFQFKLLRQSVTADRDRAPQAFSGLPPEFVLESSAFFWRRLVFDRQSRANAKAHAQCTIAVHVSASSGKREHFVSRFQR